MRKQEILDELERLYRLRDEGKNVDRMIAKLERRLFERVEVRLCGHAGLFGFLDDHSLDYLHEM